MEEWFPIMKEFVPAIAAILGTVVGGGITFIISARQIKHGVELDEKRRQLANFENLHKVLSDITNQSIVLSASATMHLAHGMPFKIDKSTGPIPFHEAKMLVDFYAPALRPDLEKLEQSWFTLGKALAEITLTSEPTTEKRGEWIVAIGTSLALISNAAEGAKQKLNELVQKYVRVQ